MTAEDIAALIDGIKPPIEARFAELAARIATLEQQLDPDHIAREIRTELNGEAA